MVDAAASSATKSMGRVVAIGLLLAITVSVAALLWWHVQRQRPPQPLMLYGNIDLRQVDLSFNGNQRIAAVLAQEGDRVRQGQVIARLDTRRLVPQVAQGEAQVAAQQQVVDRLHHGSRPEEIAQAQANVQAAQADAANARRQYERLASLFDGSAVRAVSQQDVDNAKAVLDVADAKLAVNEKVRDLAIIGPRKEDVAQAEAQLRAAAAQLALLRQQLEDAQLVAPVDATVRTRIMEPGEMASPDKPVFALAITDPKWVQAYVSEPDLGKVRPGMPASIRVDSYPGRRFDGWIGFVSPVAEFTPKSVETEELRTSLVYEVRVFVRDSSDALRLGMPATVTLSPDRRVTSPVADVPITSPVPVGRTPTTTRDTGRTR